MKLKKAVFSKEFKKGLPNYSNITVSLSLEYEFSEDENINYEAIWDEINQQLTIQLENMEQSWLITDEEKEKAKNYKFTKRQNV